MIFQTFQERKNQAVTNYILSKFIDYDSIDHPDNETVIRLLDAYKIQNKKKLEQEERNRVNNNVLRSYGLGLHKPSGNPPPTVKK